MVLEVIEPLADVGVDRGQDLYLKRVQHAGHARVGGVFRQGLEFLRENGLSVRNFLFLREITNQ